MVKDISRDNSYSQKDIDTLYQLGYLKEAKADAKTVALAAWNFQGDLGIHQDGIIGPVTGYALNNTRKNNYDIEPKTAAAARMFEKVFHQGRNVDKAHNLADKVLDGEALKDDKKVVEPAIQQAPGKVEINGLGTFSTYGATKITKGEFNNPSFLEFSLMKLEGYHARTNGSGHDISIGYGTPRGGHTKEKVSKEQAFEMMQEQVGKKLQSMDKIEISSGFRKLAPNQQDAVMSLIYNIDIEDRGKDPHKFFRNSHLANAIRDGDTKAIADYIPQYSNIRVYNNDKDKTGHLVPEKGLVKRRDFESKLFKGDIDAAVAVLEPWHGIFRQDEKIIDSYRQYYHETRPHEQASTERVQAATGFAATELPNYKADLPKITSAADQGVGPR